MSYLLNLLANFSGRIDRKSWWLGFVIILVAVVVGFVFLNPEAFAGTETMTPPSLAYTLWAVAWMIPTTAIGVKRFNDRNWPSWLGLALGFFGTVLLIAQYFGFAVDPDKFTPAESVVFGTYLVAGLFAFVDNGFLRGTPGPNQYGPDPRAAPLAA